MAKPLVSAFGAPAARALTVLTPRQARRLAILAETGELRAIGRTSELLTLVARCGDRVMDFVWRHKASLAISAVLAAFLADPEPFLNGSRDLASLTAHTVIGPLAEVPGRVAVATVRQLDGPVLALAALAAIGFALFVRRRHLRKPKPQPIRTPHEVLHDEPESDSRP